MQRVRGWLVVVLALLCAVGAVGAVEPGTLLMRDRVLVDDDLGPDAIDDSPEEIGPDADLPSPLIPEAAQELLRAAGVLEGSYRDVESRDGLTEVEAAVFLLGSPEAAAALVATLAPALIPGPVPATVPVTELSLPEIPGARGSRASVPDFGFVVIAFSDGPFTYLLVGRSRGAGTQAGLEDVLAAARAWYARVAGVAPDPIEAASSGPQLSIAIPADDLAVGAGAVWALGGRFSGRRLVRIDPSTGRRSGPATAVGADPRAVGADASGVWVAGLRPGPGTRGVLRRVDPRRLRVSAVADTVENPAELELGHGSVWVMGFGADVVARVNPRTARVLARVRMGSGQRDLAVGPGAVWALDSLVLSRIDPRTNRVAARIAHREDFPQAVAVGAGSVWIAGGTTSTGYVLRVDPATRRVVARIPITHGPRDIAVAAGAVWVSNDEGVSITRIDPATNARVGRVRLGARPGRLAAGDGVLWVSGSRLWKIVP